MGTHTFWSRVGAVTPLWQQPPLPPGPPSWRGSGPTRNTRTACPHHSRASTRSPPRLAPASPKLSPNGSARWRPTWPSCQPCPRLWRWPTPVPAPPWRASCPTPSTRTTAPPPRSPRSPTPVRTSPPQPDSGTSAAGFPEIPVSPTGSGPDGLSTGSIPEGAVPRGTPLPPGPGNHPAPETTRSKAPCLVGRREPPPRPRPGSPMATAAPRLRRAARPHLTDVRPHLVTLAWADAL
ncbi:hypothetical protein BDW27_11542 [Nocardiopsis sp. L17-MgMaSL7]|nr:hypothetical protein BDW27_11542 [Nocardiopsis sp. L17-MgMaSL7]